jgi:hypothetical protein
VVLERERELKNIVELTLIGGKKIEISGHWCVGGSFGGG